jgi:hypothetical protein
VLHEGVSKRIRIITNEIDDLKKQLDGQVVIVRRIETVEAKAQELWEQWTGEPIRQRSLPKELQEQIRRANLGQAEAFCANCDQPLHPKKPFGEVCSEACGRAVCGQRRGPKESCFDGYRGIGEVQLRQVKADLALWPQMLEMGPFIEEAEKLAREPPAEPLPFPPTAINLYSRSKGLCCKFYGMHGSTYDNGKKRPWCKRG